MTILTICGPRQKMSSYVPLSVSSSILVTSQSSNNRLFLFLCRFQVVFVCLLFFSGTSRFFFRKISMSWVSSFVSSVNQQTFFVSLMFTSVNQPISVYRFPEKLTSTILLFIQGPIKL